MSNGFYNMTQLSFSLPLALALYLIGLRISIDSSYRFFSIAIYCTVIITWSYIKLAALFKIAICSFMKKIIVNSNEPKRLSILAIFLHQRISLSLVGFYIASSCFIWLIFNEKEGPRLDSIGFYSLSLSLSSSLFAKSHYPTRQQKQSIFYNLA